MWNNNIIEREPFLNILVSKSLSTIVLYVLEEFLQKKNKI